jgi:hypothetical protein
LPQEAPSKLPTRGIGAGSRGLVCPSCGGDGFVERSSFKTDTESVLGSASTTVVIDLMNCTRCGADMPAVRGRRSYALVGEKKLSSILAELEEAQRTNSEMQALADKMSRRSQGLSRDIERCRAEGEVSVMTTRVAALEEETDGLQETRERLAKVLESIASRIPAK